MTDLHSFSPFPNITLFLSTYLLPKFLSFQVNLHAAASSISQKPKAQRRCQFNAAATIAAPPIHLNPRCWQLRAQQLLRLLSLFLLNLFVLSFPFDSLLFSHLPSSSSYRVHLRAQQLARPVMDDAVLGTSVAFTVVDSFLCFKSSSSALHKLRKLFHTPSVKVSDLLPRPQLLQPTIVVQCQARCSPRPRPSQICRQRTTRL